MSVTGFKPVYDSLMGASWAQLSRICMLVKEMQETWVWSLGREDPLEKEMATHSSILAWEIPWTEEPGGYSPWSCKEWDMSEWACTHPPAHPHTHISPSHSMTDRAWGGTRGLAEEGLSSMWFVSQGLRLREGPTWCHGHLHTKLPGLFLTGGSGGRRVELARISLAMTSVVVVQPLSCVRLLSTPRTATCQAPLSFTISQSLFKLTSIESGMHHQLKGLND